MVQLFFKEFGSVLQRLLLLWTFKSWISTYKYTNEKFVISQLQNQTHHNLKARLCCLSWGQHTDWNDSLCAPQSASVQKAMLHLHYFASSCFTIVLTVRIVHYNCITDLYVNAVRVTLTQNWSIKDKNETKV